MLKYLKISEYLFHISFDNIDNYEKLHKFLTYLNSIYEKKIFRDLKRAEAEARKREEEERLLNQKVG